MDAELLEILACPDTHHAPLTYDADAQTLTCTQCGRVFPIRDGIPVLLLDDSESGDSESGDSESGDSESGDSDTGDSEGGAA